jgi:small subunit ribosomal protein S15
LKESYDVAQKSELITKSGRLAYQRLGFGFFESPVIFAASKNKRIPMQVTADVKKKLFKKYGGSEKNTGSTPAQIALFTERINHISEHLGTNKLDHSNTRSLIKMVGQRKKLLNYLMKKDLTGYRSLIEKLKIRK